MRILIADDDHNLRYSFQRTLDGRGFEFIEAADGEEAIEKVRNERPDVVVMDVRMPGMGGLEAFERIKEIAPGLPVIIMTAYGTTDTAIEAMKRGAVDYTLKPFDVAEMEAMIARAVQQSGALRGEASVSFEPLIEDTAAPDHRHVKRLVGSSRAMQQVYKAIGQVAETDVNVLLLGESGTGTELVANAIHEHSRRVNQPFTAINCAAIPESLIESELFGHDRGAFTGATHRRLGILQACDGGTVFFDEIGEMPSATQTKLLRFLQEGEILQLGDEAPVRVDVRVIAATNQDLKTAVSAGRFRGDLFFRLDAVSIAMPPLREHIEDIEELVAFLVHRFNDEFGKEFTQIAGLAIEKLRERAWPGNVRELENVIRKAVIIGQGEVLLTDHLFDAPDPRGGDGGAARRKQRASAMAMDEVIDTIIDRLGKQSPPGLLHTLDRLLVERVLQRVDGNQVRAARLLGISRTTLRSRLERYRTLDEDGNDDETGDI